MLIIMPTLHGNTSNLQNNKKYSIKHRNYMTKENKLQRKEVEKHQESHL